MSSKNGAAVCNLRVAFAPWLALSLVVAGCGGKSPLAPAETSSPSSESASASTSVSMAANKWDLAYSPGMAAHPADASNGWLFAFPARDGVHYLTTKHGPTSASQSITASITVETTGNPFFEYHTEPGNTCDAPATVRLYLQRRGDNMSGDGAYQYYRWWSTAGASVLGPGALTITGDLTDPTQWSSVNGERGDTNEPMFRAALADISTVGFTFGGGCFFGHGVYVTPDSGHAVFTATEFVVR